MRSVSVAEPGGTIDPNDLDSIDALLDEAELEAAEEEEPTVEDLSESTADSLADAEDNDSANDDSEELDTIPEPPPEEASDEQDDDEVQDENDTSEEDNELPDDDLSNFDEDFDIGNQAEEDASQNNEEEVIKAPEPESDPDPEPEPSDEPLKKPEEASLTEDHAEKFLQKRASVVQNKEPSNLTVAEMDSIKKLIIIFSSTIIFLVVTAIGIGLWGALSSSSSLDDETMTLIKDTHEGAMQSMVKSASAEDSIKQVGKKLDALSFQLEQLNADLLQVKEVVTVSPDKGPAGLLNLENEPAAAAKAEPPAVAAQVVMDSGVGKKIDKVNAQVVVTQRRLAEVNNRVKQLQTQYTTFLKGLKELEKSQLKGQANINDLLEATKAQVKADKLKQQAMEKSRYEYSAPNSPFFDYVR